MSRIGMLLLALGPLMAAGRPEQPLPKSLVDTARADTLRLMAEMERLQEDIVAHAGALKDRRLYQLTQKTMDELGRFDQLLRKDASQETLLKQFDAVDTKVRDLVSAVRKGAAAAQTLQRTADHIDRANDDLYFALAGGAAKRLGPVTARQAHGLADAARDLERTARYALDTTGTDRAIIIDSAATLAVAAERFEKTLRNDADLKQRLADFAPVDKAWIRVVHDVGLLKPAENAHLLRSAARVDRLHQHLYRLLQIKGKRPSLSVQS